MPDKDSPTFFLELSPEAEIGKGATRRCFLHPQNPDILIKLERKKERESKSNIWEARYFGEIVEKHGEVEGLARILGFAETNLGRGLMVEAVRNADGSLSRPIADMVGAPETRPDWPPEKVYEAVKTLLDRLVSLDLRLFDLNMGNIVLKEGENGELTAFAIDLKGPYDNKEHIPISTWFSFFARKKVKRRAEKLLRRLQGLIPDS